MFLFLFISLFFSRVWALDIPHKTYQLPNGLSVILIEDHSIPQVTVDIWYAVGSSDDPKGASGFAHLFEHLMFMGTQRIPQGEFDTRMETYGGWNNASTANDYTNYYSVGPSALLDLLLFLEADRMVGLDITQQKLDLQRDVVRNERRQNYEDQPYGSIWLSLSEMMYPPGHPYHLEGIGSHEDLEAATLNTVTQFYSDWYMPNNATLCVSGDFDPNTIEEKIETYFSPIPAQKLPKRFVAEEQQQPHTPEVTLYDQIQIPAVVLAWHSPKYLSPGDAELDVVSQVLAGGNDGRLIPKFVLEEERVQEMHVFQYSHQKGSLFIMQVFVRPGNDLQKLVADIHAEIAIIADQSNPITEEDLRLSVKDLEMNFYSGLESNLARAEKLQSLKHHTGSTSNIQMLLSRYQDIQLQDVHTTIQKYLSPEKAGVIYVYPKGEEQ